MKRFALVFIVTFSGIFGAFISPFYGLCIYIWFAYIRAQEWARNVGFFNALRPSLLLALCVIVACILHRKKMFRVSILSLAILLFWFWFSLCHFNSIDSSVSSYWFDYFNKVMIMGCLISGLVNTRERFIYVFIPFILSLGFYSAKSGLYGIMHPGAKILRGPGGMLTDNNCFALGFNMIIPFIFFGKQIFTSRVVKLSLQFLYYLSIFGVVFTYSRGGFLGLCCVIFLLQIKAKRNIFVLMFGIAMISILSILFIPESYKERISTIFSSEEELDGSASGRLHFWRVAILIANDSPIFGVGPGCYASAYDKYDFSGGRFGHKRAVHNTYFQMLTNNGYPGCIFFLLIIFLSLLSCRKLRKRVKGRRDLEWVIHCANTFEVSIIGYCISCTFLSMAYADLIYHIFFLVVALEKTTDKYLKNPVIAYNSAIDPIFIDSLNSFRCNTVEFQHLTEQEVHAVTAVMCPIEKIRELDSNFFLHKNHISFILLDGNAKYFTSQENLNSYLFSLGYTSSLRYLTIQDIITSNIDSDEIYVFDFHSVKTFSDLCKFAAWRESIPNKNILYFANEFTNYDEDDMSEITVYCINESYLEEDNLWQFLKKY